MPNLTTLDKQKTLLEIPADDTSRDDVLQLLLDEVSNLIEEFCGRTFGAAEYTEFYSGDNTAVLVLAQRPVTAILSLWVDENGYWGDGLDPFGTATLLEAGAYALEKDQPDGSSRCGLVYRVNGVWPRPYSVASGNLSASAPHGTGNIKVRYTAGYGTVPGTVQLACQLAVARIWRMGKFGGLVQSENTPGYSYTLATNTLRADGMLALPPEVVSMLSRYRNLPVA